MCKRDSGKVYYENREFLTNDKDNLSSICAVSILADSRYDEGWVYPDITLSISEWGKSIDFNFSLYR
jgi:hypothetical protein